MRYFFDTEFIDDGKSIELISIGVVSEDGRQFYAENSECDLSRACEWVKENVVPHLQGGDYRMSRLMMSRQIASFVGKDPEFWAYFASYDWVALCQLYGRMIDLPDGWPMFCLDVKQKIYEREKWLGSPVVKPPKPALEHHALADAKWTKDLWLRMK